MDPSRTQSADGLTFPTDSHKQKEISYNRDEEPVINWALLDLSSQAEWEWWRVLGIVVQQHLELLQIPEISTGGGRREEETLVAVMSHE